MEKEFNFNFSFKVQVPQFIVAAWQGRGRVVRGLLRQMVPNVGTVLVTTLLVTALIYAQSVGAVPWAQSILQTGGSSSTTINYQGRLADSGGAPIDGNVGMSFALYDAQTGGNLLWGPESHDAVPVSDGLFSVKLGSVEEGGIPASILGGDVWLEVTVGGETLTPRERLGAVPYALQALTVADGAIGKQNLAPEISLLQVQSGRVWGTVNNSEWTLSQGTGNREYVVPITFDQSFNTTPEVLVSLAHLDTEPGRNTRLRVFARDVTASGFDLVFFTWADSIVMGATATWIAYGAQ